MSDINAELFEVANRIVSTPSRTGIANYQQQRSLIISALAEARRVALKEGADEIERLQAKVDQQDAYFGKCVSNDAFLAQDAMRIRQIEKLERELEEANRIAVSAMENVRRQAFIEAAEIARAYPDREPFVGKAHRGIMISTGQELAGEEIASALRAKAEETQG